MRTDKNLSKMCFVGPCGQLKTVRPQPWPIEIRIFYLKIENERKRKNENENKNNKLGSANYYFCKLLGVAIIRLDMCSEPPLRAALCLSAPRFVVAVMVPWLSEIRPFIRGTLRP